MDLSQLIDNYLMKGFTSEFAVETAKSELQSIINGDARNAKRVEDREAREEAEKQRLFEAAQADKQREEGEKQHKLEEEKLKEAEKQRQLEEEKIREAETTSGG